jgi:hypothetical protein
MVTIFHSKIVNNFGALNVAAEDTAFALQFLRRKLEFCSWGKLVRSARQR